MIETKDNSRPPTRPRSGPGRPTGVGLTELELAILRECDATQKELAAAFLCSERTVNRLATGGTASKVVIGRASAVLLQMISRDSSLFDRVQLRLGYDRN